MATTIGVAVVVHEGEDCTVEARSMAQALPLDPDCDLLVVDVTPGASEELWAAVADAVPKGRRPLRLVPAQHPRELSPQVAQSLSERLGRPVLAPLGTLFQSATGTLFVQAGLKGGWARFERGHAPVTQGRRFPGPPWESSITAEPAQLTTTASVEPLPAGVWLRSDGDDAALESGRFRLTRWLPGQPNVLMVVLGGEWLPELPLDSVTKFWSLLPDVDRARTRFVQFGPVELPRPISLGQTLADVLGAEVRCYTGMPSGSPDEPDVFILRADGSHAWKTCAEQYAYLPGNPTASPPRLCAYRPPVAGLAELSPGLYRYTPDALVEVVSAGLWVRATQESRHAELVRSVPPDPTRHLVLYEGAHGTQLARMHECAERLVADLDYSIRLSTTVMPVTELVDPRPRSDSKRVEQAITRPTMDDEPGIRLPLLSQLLETAQLSPLSPPPAPVPPVRIAEPMGRAVPVAADSAARAVPVETVQLPAMPEPVESVESVVSAVLSPAEPVTRSGPAVEVPAGPVDDSLSAAREWLDETWPDEFDAQTDAVEDVLASNPKVFRTMLDQGEDARVDAVALRMYLAQQGIDVDAGLRAEKTGAYAAFGRCVAAGLALLPPYRGVTMTTLTPTAAQWAFLQARSVVTERGFLNLLTAPSADQQGEVDLLVWSTSGRRTTLFEPDDGVADRVVFLPGTAFKVLDLIEAQPERRGRIVLRELSPADITEDGQPVPNRTSLDQMVRTALERAADRWTNAEARCRIPASAAHRFRRLPGVDDD